MQRTIVPPYAGPERRSAAAYAGVERRRGASAISSDSRVRLFGHSVHQRLIAFPLGQLATAAGGPNASSSLRSR